MSNLRVGVVAYDWYPFHTRVRRLAEAAADAGYETHVMCLLQAGERRHECVDGVYVHRMPMGRGFGLPLPITILAWLWFMVMAGAALTWQHMRHPFDVILVHNMPDFLVFAALVPKLLGAKVVLDVQDPSPELMSAKSAGAKRAILRRLATWEEGISTRFSDHIITVGWPFEELLLKRGVPREKLSVFLQCADPKQFPAALQSDPPSWSYEGERPFIMMYYGSLAPRNCVDTAIRAVHLAQPRVPQLRLDIMGFGEEIPTLQALAADLGVSDRIRFSDPCPSDKVVDFVVHGDVGIIPYRVDGFEELVLPTKAYELAWMRRPMIASDTVGIRSMFRSNSIILCDPTKPEAFAEAIVKLYEHPELQRTLVDRAAEDYTPYRWESTRRTFQLLLGELGGKRTQSLVTSSAR